MTVLNDRTGSLLRAQMSALCLATGVKDTDLPATAGITTLLKHGGVYTLLDPEMMNARLTALKLSGAPGAGLLNVEYLTTTAQAQLTYFFYHLVPRPFEIPSDLMSHIAFPHEGRTYSNRATNTASLSALPAAFTFIGQFIDHDLTMNAMELFMNQGGQITDGASPFIDLDSVYGPRVPPMPNPGATSPGAQQPPATPPSALMDGTGRFVLAPIPGRKGKPPAGYDYPRDGATGTAKIPDGRNDENQIIAQIQILLMRLHNRFVDAGMTADAQRQTVYTWQSVVLSDYLPRIIGKTAATAVYKDLQAKNFASLHHRPLTDPTTGRYVVSMPHEFAIAFRFGHSQLRSKYELNGHAGPIDLFDNQAAKPNDLRGGRPLDAEHVIDWSFFLPSSGPRPSTISNEIDKKVTGAVFDLPESTIPDDIKYIGNLPHRNLIRSRQVGLASGESVAKAFGLKPVDIKLIEPTVSKRALFRDPNNGEVATPLWYYVLAEAQLAGEGKIAAPDGPGFLGPLGGRLVGEVVGGAVFWAPEAFVKDPQWSSPVTGSRTVRFQDIVVYVNGKTVSAQSAADRQFERYLK